MEIQKAEEKAGEAETPQVVPPTTEQPTTGAETMVKEPVDQVPLTEGESDLPADVEEQRRAFQEQRLEIKRLREEAAKREKSESAFNAFRVQTPPIGQPVELRIENFTNPVTGETDYAAYNQAVNQVIQRQATQSASFIAQQTTNEMLDENNARLKHPTEFKDKNFEQRVADRWVAAKFRGENPSISDIADDEANLYGKAISKAEKVGEEKALTDLSEKEKAGLSASGQTSTPARQESSREDFEQLQAKTRRGDFDAVAARISKIPWANK